MNNCDKSENLVRQLRRKIQNSKSELTNSAAMYLTLSNDLRSQFHNLKIATMSQLIRNFENLFMLP